MKKFHVLLVGMAAPILIRTMLYVQEKCKYHFSFIVSSTRDVVSLLNEGISPEIIYCLSEHKLKEADLQDIEYLSSLEQEDVPTIHNIIMSDRVVNKLPYADGIAYAAHLARRFKSLYKELSPSVVVGGYDGMHSAIGFAVAKAEAIPWFSLRFSPIPRGYTALNPRLFPKEMVCLREQKDDDLYNLAEKTLRDFENKQIKTPASISAHNIGLVTQRLPGQLRQAFRVLKATYFGELNKYLEYNFKFILKQYVRKRKNMLRLPQKWFLKEPPTYPYLFFGFHKQPESTVDVFVNFHSNQFDIVEKIARSIPPTHKLLVKLHISDADNYSRKQLLWISKLPGVKLVSPNAPSRAFIENSSAVITIVGTIGLEAALLGKPALTFGKINYEHFPSVTRIVDITNLPNLIKQKLSEQKPSRDSIIDAYKEYLKPYFRTGHNDWRRKHLSQEEKDGYVEMFHSLEKYLETQSDNLKEGSV